MSMLEWRRSICPRDPPLSTPGLKALDLLFAWRITDTRSAYSYDSWLPLRKDSWNRQGWKQAMSVDSTEPSSVPVLEANCG